MERFLANRERIAKVQSTPHGLMQIECNLEWQIFYFPSAFTTLLSFLSFHTSKLSTLRFFFSNSFRFHLPFGIFYLNSLRIKRDVLQFRIKYCILLRHIRIKKKFFVSRNWFEKIKKKSIFMKFALSGLSWQSFRRVSFVPLEFRRGWGYVNGKLNLGLNLHAKVIFATSSRVRSYLQRASIKGTKRWSDFPSYHLKSTLWH